MQHPEASSMNSANPPLHALLESLTGEILDGRVATAVAVGVLRLDGSEARLWKVTKGAPEDAWFDLASITKTVTALTASSLSSRGAFDLDAPLESALPELRRTSGGNASARLHLAHRAGLLPHLPLYDETELGAPLRRERALVRAARARRASPAEVAVYSDLGYVLVGAALERVLGAPLDELVAREIGEDIAVRSVRRITTPDGVAPWVATEWVPGRGGRLRGVVHDDNAWALEGRALAGHAGAFGTLDGVLALGARFLRAVLGGDAWTDAVLAMTRRWEGGSFRMGFDGVSPRSSAGMLASASTFGHLGFTGTSLWIDPERRAVIALLTNRVFFGRDPAKIKATRPRVHDAIWAALDGRNP